VRDNYNFKEKQVLVIHTDKEGDVTKADLEDAREAARDIDLPINKVKVIVSVLMLREGWDVRNVTVVLGLRPFTSSAKILPEQGVGRGLRLMQGISPDRTQTLEVMGTQAFEDFVRQLETEGVGIKTTNTPPAPPVKIEPVAEKAKMTSAYQSLGRFTRTITRSLQILTSTPSNLSTTRANWKRYIGSGSKWNLRPLRQRFTRKMLPRARRH
jgi:hypothetical protein